MNILLRLDQQRLDHLTDTEFNTLDYLVDKRLNEKRYIVRLQLITKNEQTFDIVSHQQDYHHSKELIYEIQKEINIYKSKIKSLELEIKQSTTYIKTFETFLSSQDNLNLLKLLRIKAVTVPFEKIIIALKSMNFAGLNRKGATQLSIINTEEAIEQCLNLSLPSQELPKLIEINAKNIIEVTKEIEILKDKITERNTYLSKLWDTRNYFGTLLYGAGNDISKNILRNTEMNQFSEGVENSLKGCTYTDRVEDLLEFEKYDFRMVSVLNLNTDNKPRKDGKPKISYGDKFITVDLCPIEKRSRHTKTLSSTTMIKVPKPNPTPESEPDLLCHGMSAFDYERKHDVQGNIISNKRNENNEK